MYDAKPAANVIIGAGTAKDCSSTGVFAYTWNLTEPGTIKQLIVKTTTAMVSSAATVITFRRRPTYGSSSGQSSLGTVSVAATAAANAVFVNNITPVNLNVGDQIVADCTTAATTSGSVIANIVADYSAETSLNESVVTVVTA